MTRRPSARPAKTTAPKALPHSPAVIPNQAELPHATTESVAPPGSAASPRRLVPSPLNSLSRQSALAKSDEPPVRCSAWGEGGSTFIQFHIRLWSRSPVVLWSPRCSPRPARPAIASSVRRSFSEGGGVGGPGLGSPGPALATSLACFASSLARSASNTRLSQLTPSAPFISLGL